MAIGNDWFCYSHLPYIYAHCALAQLRARLTLYNDKIEKFCRRFPHPLKSDDNGRTEKKPNRERRVAA